MFFKYKFHISIESIRIKNTLVLEVIDGEMVKLMKK